MARDVCDAEVEEEDKDEDWNCDERVWVCGWEEDFEEGIEGIEAVLGDLQLLAICNVLVSCMFAGVGVHAYKTYIRPTREDLLVKRRTKQDRPKDNSHQERERRDSRVQQTMQDAKNPWPAVEEYRATSPRIAGCVDSRDEEVEAQTPVGQPGEVAEGLADGDGVIMGAVPGPDGDDAGEDVKSDQGT